MSIAEHSSNAYCRVHVRSISPSHPASSDCRLSCSCTLGWPPTHHRAAWRAFSAAVDGRSHACTHAPSAASSRNLAGTRKRRDRLFNFWFLPLLECPSRAGLRPGGPPVAPNGVGPWARRVQTRRFSPLLGSSESGPGAGDKSGMIQTRAARARVLPSGRDGLSRERQSRPLLRQAQGRGGELSAEP